MRKRRVFAALTAVTLSMLFPLTSFAATWENVDTWDKLAEAFANDTDADVVIMLDGDIECLGTLTANIGQTYTINGEEYVLTHVYLDGQGSVVVNTDLDGIWDDALTTCEEVQVTVNGTITGDMRGVYAADSSDVTVNGDITVSENDGVFARDGSMVAVTGNVTSGSDGINSEGSSTVTVTGNVTAGDDGIEAEGSSTVTVTGNVSAEDDGIYANDNSTVTVTGNVSGEEDGIDASENSTVTVTGNVSGEDEGVEANDKAVVMVDGNVSGTDGEAPDEEGNLEIGDMNTPGSYSDGGDGVYAEGEAAVTVTGDVTGGNAYGSYGYAGDGAIVNDTASLTVGGSVTGGSVTANPEVPSEEMYSRGGLGIVMDDTASVSVGGDVTGGNTNGQDGTAGTGAEIIVSLKRADGEKSEAGVLLVAGTVTGGTAENGTDASAITATSEGIVQEEIPDASLSVDIVISMTRFGYERIMGVAMDSGLSDEEAQEYAESYLADLEQLFVETTGTDLMGIIDSYDALEELLGSMEEEDVDALLKGMLALYNAHISEFVSVETFPEITVWGLQGGGDAALCENLAGEVIGEVFGAEINYLIRVADGDHGSLSVDKETAKAGETVTVIPKADAGYKVSKVLLNGTELTAVDGVYSFVVQEGGKVEVSAVFEAAEVKAAAAVPPTGDSTPITAMAVVLLAAVGGIGVLVLCRKRINVK